MDTPNLSLVALTSTEIVPAQQAVADWCRSKIVTLGAELRDQRQNLRQAKKLKWKHSGWQRMAALTAKRMVYYTKIRAAVQQGYLIIPNLPVELLAVRVQREVPKRKYGTYPSDVNEAAPELLPWGEGRYVDEITKHADHSYTESDGKGGTKTVRRVEAGGYREEIDFPFLLVKPQVLQATQRAMMGNLFDQIGVAHGEQTSSKARRRSDPIVVGQLIDPRSTTYHKRKLTFFIAWWLNTEDL